jgi:hypothetical protein
MHVYTYQRIFFILWLGCLICGLLLADSKDYKLIGWILLLIGIFPIMLTVVFHWLGWYD